MSELDSFYADYVSTLDADEQGSRLLDAPVPQKQRDATPIPGQQEEPEGTSIRQRVESGAYSATPYALYSELKQVAVQVIQEEALGSPGYAELYTFIRFAVDLLLRELARLSLAAPSGPQNTGDPFLYNIAEVFQKVYADADEWYGEALYTVTQSGPMFTSMTGRASFDPRETEEHGAVHPSKLLPHIASSHEIQLGTVSGPQSRFPHPALPPTEILNDFTAPVKTPLAHTNWIRQDVYGSFAPSHDNSGSFVSDSLSSAVWIERSLRSQNDRDDRSEMDDRRTTATSRAQSRRQESPATETPAPPSASASASANATPNSGAVPLPSLPTTPLPPPPASLAAALNANALALANGHGNGNGNGIGGHGPTPGAGAGPGPIPGQVPGQILGQNASQPQSQPGDLQSPVAIAMSQPVPEPDLVAVLQWTPSSFVDDDELEAAEKGTELELVSRLLLELQHLQRERLSAPGLDLVASDEETHTALKIQNILARLAQDADASQLALPVSKKLPVLMRNYVGTLPFSEQKPAPRLTSVSQRGQRQQRRR